jgi:dihydroflavonol-4-reductase
MVAVVKVLVTGGTGHIGNVVVRKLVASGADVRVLVYDDRPSLEEVEVERIQGDVRDAEAVSRALQGVEVVWHLAAVIAIDGDPKGLARSVNIDGAKTVAREALRAGVRRMVHVSSIHAFDHAPHFETLDESRQRAGQHHPAYDRSKVAGEAAVREAIGDGLDAVIVHPTGVLGPFDFEPSHAGSFLLGAAVSKYPLLPNGGFNWVDVRDVADTILAAATRGRTGENYIAGGHWASAYDLAHLGARLAGARAPLGQIPLGLARAASHGVLAVSRALGLRGHYTPDAVFAMNSNRKVSSAKAERELGHRARPTEETVRDAYLWYHARGMLSAKAKLVVDAAQAVAL